MPEPCWRVELGRRDFDEVLALQRRLVVARQQGRVPDILLVVEHPPTYTFGRSSRPEHLLADEATLAGIGARVIETDRGGDITFHGPGQLVGYPILDLKAWKRDVHEYLRAIEALLIDAVGTFGIAAHREQGLTGVWHPSGKLAAIGVRVSRWVTSHGFALNIATELDYYQHIVPCGIFGRAVTSMENVLKAPVARGPVRDAVSRSFARAFDRDVEEAREIDLEVCTR
jgi:lipoyl(octanoyl) transferase